MVDISKFESIKGALQEGESALWVGKPGSFGLTDGVMKTPILLRWILSVVLAAVLLVAYITVYGGTAVFQPLIVVVIVAVFGFLIIRPVMDKNTIMKKVNYCITDKRVILSVGHRDLYDITRAGLKAKVVDAGNGNVHVAIGKCSELAEKKYRSASLAPKRGEGDMITGFVMYNVDKCVGDFFVS